jgi:hypothetical protein
LIARKSDTYFLFVFCLFCSGCSFHSNQLEALKAFFRKEPGPEPQWLLSWGEVNEKVFAINAGPSIFFANSDGMLVHFNGSFVDRIDGLKVSSEKVITITITKTKIGSSEVFSFRGLAADFGDLYCELPSEVSSESVMKNGIMQSMEIRQNCTVDDKLVGQSIMLNQSRQLVGLKFVLHPGHEPATIRYNPS